MTFHKLSIIGVEIFNVTRRFRECFWGDDDDDDDSHGENEMRFFLFYLIRSLFLDFSRSA